MVMISQLTINLSGLPDLASAPNALATCSDRADYSKHSQAVMNRKAMMNRRASVPAIIFP